MKEGIEVTLEQLLDARDQRAARQRMHISKLEVPLVSFTVNMPGAYKKTSESCFIFREGCDALKKKLEESFGQPVCRQIYELDTGYEALIGVNTDAKSLKENVLQLERTHPLGRLFDFDVIDLDEIPISREALGYPKRKCLLCEQDAHICGRSGKHGIDELAQKIREIVEAYQQDI
ncbi:MAG: hypothetical protein APF77_24815 [Clostridia bacterium BRH_c25]|nr:MAG: hypothetical protein APF77_24815 [Clostridia bacterium BRH_c25]